MGFRNATEQARARDLNEVLQKYYRGRSETGRAAGPSEHREVSRGAARLWDEDLW
jgi:hypothetical protein